MSLISEYLEKISNKKHSAETDVNLPPMLFDSNQENHKKKKLIKVIGVLGIASILIFAITAFLLGLFPFRKSPGSLDPEIQGKISAQTPEKKQLITRTIPVQTEEQKQEIDNTEKSAVTPDQNPKPIGKADQLTINVGNVATLKDDEPLDQEARYREEEIKEDQGLISFQKKQNQKTGYKLFFNMGLNSQKNNDYAKAEKYYQKSLDIKSDYKKSLINLSTIYIHVGNLDKAIELLDKLYELDPDNIKTCVNFGIVYLKQKKYEKAEAFLSKAVDKDKNNLVSLYNMAVMYQKTGQYDKALDFYNRVITTDPDNFKSLLAMSSIYEQKQEYSKAVDHYEKCLTIPKVISSEKLNQKIKNRIRVIRSFWEK